jgi:hypothetical protein
VGPTRPPPAGTRGKTLLGISAVPLPLPLILIGFDRAFYFFYNASSTRQNHSTWDRYYCIPLPNHRSFHRLLGSFPPSATTMYTASFAFLEALWDGGVTHCFVNLGSDHPSIIEAIAKGLKERNGAFMRIITCPTEVRNRSPYPLKAWPTKRHAIATDNVYGSDGRALHGRRLRAVDSKATVRDRSR